MKITTKRGRWKLERVGGGGGSALPKDCLILSGEDDVQDTLQDDRSVPRYIYRTGVVNPP